MGRPAVLAEEAEVQSAPYYLQIVSACMLSLLFLTSVAAPAASVLLSSPAQEPQSEDPVPELSVAPEEPRVSLASVGQVGAEEEPTPPPGAQQIAANSIYTGTLEKGEESEWYRVAVHAGERTLVLMNPPEGADFDLYVSWPGGQRRSSLPGRTTEGAVFVPETDGWCYIDVIRVSGWGDYQFAVFAGVDNLKPENEQAEEQAQETATEESEDGAVQVGYASTSRQLYGALPSPTAVASRELAAETGGLGESAADWIRKVFEKTTEFTEYLDLYDGLNPAYGYINYTSWEGRSGLTHENGYSGVEFKGITLVLPANEPYKPMNEDGQTVYVYRYVESASVTKTGLGTGIPHHYIFVYKYNDPVLNDKGAHWWDVEHVTVYLNASNQIQWVETGSHETTIAYEPDSLHFDQYGSLLVFAARRSHATVCDTQDFFFTDALRSYYVTGRTVIAIDNMVPTSYTPATVVDFNQEVYDPNSKQIVIAWDNFRIWDVEDGAGGAGPDGIFDRTFPDGDNIAPENQKIKHPSKKLKDGDYRNAVPSYIYTTTERHPLGRGLLLTAYCIDALSEHFLKNGDIQMSVLQNPDNFVITLIGSYNFKDWGVGIEVRVPFTIDESGKFLSEAITPEVTLNFDGANIGGVITLSGDITVKLTIQLDPLNISWVYVGSHEIKINVENVPGIDAAVDVTITNLQITWDGQISGSVESFSVKFHGWTVALNGISIDDSGLYIQSGTVKFGEKVPALDGGKYLEGTVYGLRISPTSFSLQGADIELGNIGIGGYTLASAKAHFYCTDEVWKLGATATVKVADFPGDSLFGGSVKVSFDIQNTEPYLTHFGLGTRITGGVQLGSLPLCIGDPGFYFEVNYDGDWHAQLVLSGDVWVGTVADPPPSSPLWINGRLVLNLTNGQFENFGIEGDLHVFSWTIGGAEVYFCTDHIEGSGWLNLANVVTGHADFTINYGGFAKNAPENAIVMQAEGELQVLGFQVASCSIDFRRAYGVGDFNLDLGPFHGEVHVKYAFPPVVDPQDAFFYGNAKTYIDFTIWGWFPVHVDGLDGKILINSEGTTVMVGIDWLGAISFHWDQGCWWPSIIFGDAVGDEPNPTITYTPTANFTWSTTEGASFNLQSPDTAEGPSDWPSQNDMGQPGDASSDWEYLTNPRAIGPGTGTGYLSPDEVSDCCGADVYTFHALKGQQIIIQVENQGSGLTQFAVTLYDPNKSIPNGLEGAWEVIGNPVQITAKAPMEGNYYLCVISWNQGEEGYYSLTLKLENQHDMEIWGDAGDNASDARDITNGGYFSPLEDSYGFKIGTGYLNYLFNDLVDWYKISFRAGQAFKIRVSASNPANVIFLSLYQDGRRVAYKWGENEVVLRYPTSTSEVLSSDGEYYLSISMSYVWPDNDDVYELHVVFDSNSTPMTAEISATGPENIQVYAQDMIGIENITLFANGSPVQTLHVGQRVRGDPDLYLLKILRGIYWNTSLNKYNLPDGTYTVYARVVDGLGNVATSDNISVRINNPPILKIQSQTTNVGNGKISVYAWDAGGIENVEFYVNGELRSWFDNQNGSECWNGGDRTRAGDTYGAQVGSYSYSIIKVVVHDHAGNRTEFQSRVGGDGKVDITDLGTFGWAWNSMPGDPNWNPRADINRDGIVDITDLGTFGWAWNSMLGDPKWDPRADIA